jgi:putative phosphoesterase
MKKIALLSDTHNVLREEVQSNIEDCDYILHAGDVNNQEVLNALQSIAPTVIVRGNTDIHLEHLPTNATITIEGITIYITHKKIDIPQKLENIQIVMYGHSHKYESYFQDGIQYINPGSCGRRRFSLPLTMAYLYIDDTKYTIEKVNISWSK